MTTRIHDSLAPLALALCLVGCGGAEEPAPLPAEDLLAPPPEGQGVQFRMVTEIGPGVEAEHCRFVKAPPGGIHVNRDQVRYTAGSHHVLLYETPYDEIPTAKEDGTPVDTSGVFDCSDGASNGWAVTKLVGGSQNADGDSVVSFPPGVAMHVRPGAVLMINAHYINASSAPLRPEVAINLYTIPEAEVEQEGDILFLYDLFIKVGAQSAGRAHIRCPVRRDITIVNVQSHMHARGVGYEASIAGGAPFYTNDRWEGVPVESFEGGLQVKAGEMLDYHCDYRNAEERDVFQGPRSTDEMCMLIGSYYPADPATSYCSADPEQPLEATGLAAEWIGTGAASCAASMRCVERVLSAGLEEISPRKEAFKDLVTCVVDSDPAVSKELSSFVRCAMQNEDYERACSEEICACNAR
ncbi:hypothetical protein [Polyangium aurulentum]|uniref:monooxygenase n=1 Tax=Polyangium aurulentum TaxID=2567896 RepID=UPI001469B3AE|nr:hypothetical protein [Polyangium aurulentum]UQA59492.1 hypothetical protein E8A73_002985 [Polyangium aurulentum]